MDGQGAAFGRCRAAADGDRDVLAPPDLVGHGAARDRRADDGLPEQFARAVVERHEAPVDVAGEQQATGRRYGRAEYRGTLLVPPGLAAGGDVDGVDAPDRVRVAGHRRVLDDQPADRIAVLGRGRIGVAGLQVAEVLLRLVHQAGTRAVRARRPVFPAAERRTDQDLLERADDQVFLDVHLAAALDGGDDVLVQRFPGPEKFAGFPVERIDDTRLAGNTRHHAPELAGREAGIDPRHFGGVRRHGHVDQVAFEDMVQVPVVARQVLVVPDRVAGGRIRRQGAVGIQHIVPLGAAQPLQRRLRYRGAPVQEPEFRIVARHVAPASYMPAQLVGQVVPAFVSRFAGSRDGPPTP